MTRWDGLTTEDDTRIIVLGATNLPNALDPAVLRRLPKRYPVGLPNAVQRRKIFDILLKKASLAPDFSIDRLVVAQVARKQRVGVVVLRAEDSS